MIRAGNGSVSGAGGALTLSAGDGQSDASGGSVFISAGVGTTSGNITVTADVLSIAQDGSSNPLLQVRTLKGNEFVTMGNVDASCSPFDDDYTKNIWARSAEIVMMGGESISITTEAPPGRVSGGTKIEIGTSFSSSLLLFFSSSLISVCMHADISSRFNFHFPFFRLFA
jgi:hypothetical protein